MKIGLTPEEFRVLLLLVAVFTIGIVLKEYSEPENKSIITDYSIEDSLFLEGAIKGDSLVSYSNLLQKKVDSKQELYDFSGNKLFGNNKSATKKLNINSADVPSLVSLPGIGIKTALRIDDYRKQYGRFNKLSDLLRIKGIGEAKLKRIKKFIIIE